MLNCMHVRTKLVCFGTGALQVNSWTCIMGTSTLTYISALLPQLLMTNAKNYSKGLLSEILEFVMGNGMIPGEHDSAVRAKQCHLSRPCQHHTGQ